MKLKNFKNFIKNLFHRPIYRKDILMYVNRKTKLGGLCYSIHKSCEKYHFDYYSDFQKVFPLYTYENAKKFGASGGGTGYWWRVGEWNNGRQEFLDWLIKQYENDKEDLTITYKEYYNG